MTTANANWYAVHTRPRQENTALAHLERQQFQCFLPKADMSGRRARTRSEPLFPRYLFLHADPASQSLASVRSTRGVVGLVRAGVEMIKIPASVIAGLKARVHAGTGLIALDSGALRDGDRVRVGNGPFASLEGIFQEHRGQTRSMLLIQILGQQTEVEMDPRWLQRVG